MLCENLGIFFHNFFKNLDKKMALVFYTKAI